MTPVSVASHSSRQRACGVGLLFAAALGLGLSFWFVSSTFLPLAYPDRPVEYVFLGASPLLLGVAVAAAAVLLALTHVRLVPDSPEKWSCSGLGYMAPLALLGLTLLASTALLPWAGDRLSVIVYVFDDLRPWWAAALTAAAVLRLDRQRGSPWRTRIATAAARLTPSTRAFVLEAALFLLFIGSAIVSSTHLRFTAVLHGDEPKYMRLCENLYQGRGLHVAGQQRMEELSLAYSPPVWRNLARLGETVRQDLGHLRDDARIFFNQGLSFRYNRAQFVDGWFLQGRNGGFYQVHNPGLSFLLFPAYFVDRHFFSTSAAYQDVFPAQLPITNLACLLLYASMGVAVFRLLRASTGRVGLAWLLAAAAMLTMPIAAFPFQIYPEVPAGLIVAIVCRWLLFRDRESRRAAIAAGVFVAFLPWLHVRFLVLSAVLAVWGCATARRTRFTFAAAYALVILGLCLYAYHLTGSLRPDAMYQGEGSSAPWILREALQAFVSFPLDRIWGFLPHAPVYLFAIPGWAVVARVQPRAALLLALLIASLVIPSGGHGFSAAGATPLRHLVAVVPLAMVPLAWTLIRWGHRSWVRVAFAILLVISLDAAFSYNFHHQKEVGRMVDWATSGWTPNLLFPWTHATPWQQWPGTFALFVTWVGAIVAMLLIPFALTRRTIEARPHTPVRLHHVVTGGVVFIAVAFATTAAGGEWTRTDYFIPVDRARAELIAHLAAVERCRICYSSIRGEIGRPNAMQESPGTFRFEALRAGVAVGEPVAFRAIATVPEGHGWGTLAVDFGDDTVARVDLFGVAELRHAYRTPGERRATARFTPYGSTFEQRTAIVTVHPAALDPSLVHGLPDGFLQAPVRHRIDRLWVGPDGLSVEHSMGANGRVWALEWNGGGWIVVDLTSPTSTAPADGARIAVIVGDPASSSRSDPLFVDWPPASTVIGAPVVLFP